MPGRVEHVGAVVLRRVLALHEAAAREPDLLEGSLVHVFEEFVLLCQLVLEHDELGVDFAVLVPQIVNLHLRVHILLVEVLPRLKSHLRDLALELPRDFVW